MNEATYNSATWNGSVISVLVPLSPIGGLRSILLSLNTDPFACDPALTATFTTNTDPFSVGPIQAALLYPGTDPFACDPRMAVRIPNILSPRIDIEPTLTVLLTQDLDVFSCDSSMTVLLN